MSTRPKTQGTKKSVNFALTGTKIGPPDDVTQSKGISNQYRNTQTEFRVNRAKEYESFLNIPKFSHQNMAVIHPPPFKRERKHWMPASDLQFDGRPMNLEDERSIPKQLPDHLIKPALNEAAVSRARDRERSMSPGKKGK